MYLGFAAACCAVLYFFERKNNTNMMSYLAAGLALWYCLLRGGVNADIAGVVAAFAVPAKAPAPKGSLAPPEVPGHAPTLIDHLLHQGVPWSTLLIMPLFALANTAIALDTSTVASLPHSPVAQGIALGLIVGKPVGIVLVSLLGIKFGVAQWPDGMDVTQLAVLGLLGGIGFTMCLFLIEQSLVGAAAAAAKMAVIAASATCACLGAGALSLFPEHKGTLPDAKAALGSA